ncbi:MAG: hypothetical protein LQ343_005216 [Gyalolechia ehrenbergii]|nr:MAG: hypothetical protein LQ343_005216 [Gyalolechia ehrenbergii]
MSQTLRFVKEVRSESSKAECKDYKLRGIDTGPCGNSAINYTSISLIIFVVASICLAVYLKTSRARRKPSVNVRPQPVIGPYQTEHGARQKREQQERVIQQRLDDERRRQNIPARAVTDLSGQQTQLAERLNQLQQELETALEQQQRRGNEALADDSGLMAPDTVHLRTRERDWERYQMRSNQDIMARLEHAGSIIQRIRSNEEENQSTNTARRQHQVPESLPEYAVEDPLADQTRVPAYTL